MQSTTIEARAPVAAAEAHWTAVGEDRHIAVFGPVTLAVHAIPGLSGWYASADPDLFRSQKLGMMPLEDAQVRAVEMLRTVMESSLAKIPGGLAPSDLWALAASAERRKIRAKILHSITMNTFGKQVGGITVVDRDELLSDLDTFLPEER
jgi:hypothetical protein